MPAPNCPTCQARLLVVDIMFAHVRLLVVDIVFVHRTSVVTIPSVIWPCGLLL